MTDAPPLDRLTPAVAAEVRRTLLLGAAIPAAAVLGMGVLLVAFIPGSTGLGLVAFLTIVLGLMYAGGVLACYLAGGWVGLLRTSFVARTWGIDPERLSNAAMRGQARTRGHWLAALKGLAVGAALLGAAGLAYWAATGRAFNPVGWVMVLWPPAFVSVRARAVRLAVAEKLAAPPAPPLP